MKSDKQPQKLKHIGTRDMELETCNNLSISLLDVIVVK
jgi:hypothetical protein